MTKNKKKDVNKQKKLETRSVKIRNFFTQRIEGPIDRPIDRPIERQIDRPIERQIDRPIERQIDRPIERQIDRSTNEGSCVIQRYQDQEKKSRKIRMKFFNIIGNFFTSLFTPIKNSATQAVNVINVSFSSVLGNTIKWTPRTSTENADAFKNMFSYSDPQTRYVSMNEPPIENGYRKQVLSYMYDKRINNGSGGVLDFGGGYDYILVYDFEPVFSNGYRKMRIVVNSEIVYNQALNYAIFYANIFGKMPRVLVDSISEVWVHKNGFDKYLAIGGSKILIYAENATKDYISGTLEEILFHEAVHTGIDKYCINNYFWEDAQTKDAKWISEYARDNPYREDVAETFLVYYALKYRRNTISDVTAQIIQNTIPNRILFFDNLINDYRLDMNML